VRTKAKQLEDEKDALLERIVAANPGATNDELFEIFANRFAPFFPDSCLEWFDANLKLFKRRK
jgi:hypothetical protein